MCYHLKTIYDTSIPALGFTQYISTTDSPINTLSLHDALPICTYSALSAKLLRLMLSGKNSESSNAPLRMRSYIGVLPSRELRIDRKSTRLNSSHGYISYAVFCLKKKRLRYPI